MKKVIKLNRVHDPNRGETEVIPIYFCFNIFFIKKIVILKFFKS